MGGLPWDVAARDLPVPEAISQRRAALGIPQATPRAQEAPPQAAKRGQGQACGDGQTAPDTQDQSTKRSKSVYNIISTQGWVLQAFDQVPSDLETGGSHEGQPKSRQIGRQHRHRDQPPPQSSLPGVLPDQVAVSHYIRAAYLEDAALAGRQVLRRQEVAQNIIHGDGLGWRREPPRADHHRQPVGQRLHQIERQAARPDYHRRPELDGFDARSPQNLADLVTAAEMRGKFRVGIVTQTTEVDDASYPDLSCCPGEVQHRLPVLSLEVL